MTQLQREAAQREKKTVAIAAVQDFPPGARVEVRIGSRKIAIFNVDGHYYGIHGICPHQFAPLAEGRLQGTVICNAETGWQKKWAYDGEIIVCPGHAMEFHVKTGKAIGYDLRLRTYEVLVEDGEVKLVL